MTREAAKRPVRPGRIEKETAHRPWPLPDLPWVLSQSWRDLLFAHWPLPAERLREIVPDPLEVDEFDGQAWVGITPFRLTDLRPRGMPAVPGASDFLEMNLRTYVRVGGKPGVHFLSMDAASRTGVWGARVAYGLPYYRAEMEVDRDEDGWIRYRSRREGGDAEFVGRYRPDGPALRPLAGTLEHFLTERYALYAVRGGSRRERVVRGDIHHLPWSVQPAEAVIERNTVASAAGLELPDTPPLLHFAARQDALVWPPETVDARGR